MLIRCCFVPGSEVDAIPEDRVGVDGQGLMESQEIAKRVYRLANWIVQRSGQELSSYIRGALADIQDEKDVCVVLACDDSDLLELWCFAWWVQSRLDRKRRHTTLRCAFAFRLAMHLLTHLRFVHATALTESADTKVTPTV